MKRLKIFSLREVLWDLFPEGELFGGAPNNFACQAALQGAEVSMLSAVGDDDRGRRAISILSEHHVDVSLMQTVPEAPTGTVGVELDKNCKPTYFIHEGSAWDQLQWHDEIASQVQSANAACFGTLGQRSEVSRKTIRRALQAAIAAGIPRVVDINLRLPFFDADMIRDSVQLASILKMSDEELAEVCSACGISEAEDEEAMRRLLKFGELDIVVMTRGADGAILVSADSVIEQEGIPTSVIDTVGAGDSFTAAFLIGELQGKPRQDSLRRACEVAAATCSHSGAVRAHSLETSHTG
ncbi:MAG: carbohydrate kinase [Planctomycetota bacterium]